MEFLKSSVIRQKTVNLFRCLAFRLGFGLKTYREKRRGDLQHIDKTYSGNHKHGAIIEAIHAWQTSAAETLKKDGSNSDGTPSIKTLIDIVKAADPSSMRSLRTMEQVQSFVRKRLVEEASHDPYLIKIPPSRDGRKALKPSSAQLWAWADPRGGRKQLGRRWDINRWPKKPSDEEEGAGLQTPEQGLEAQETEETVIDVDTPDSANAIQGPPIAERVTFPEDALRRKVIAKESDFWPPDMADTPLKRRYEEDKIRKCKPKPFVLPIRVLTPNVEELADL